MRAVILDIGGVLELTPATGAALGMTAALFLDTAQAIAALSDVVDESPDMER